jgi:type VI protein secretion system component VasF
VGPVRKRILPLLRRRERSWVEEAQRPVRRRTNATVAIVLWMILLILAFIALVAWLKYSID